MDPNKKEAPYLIQLGHELNNVWTGLLGSAELLQMSISTASPEHEFIQMLLDGINQGEQITQKIAAIAHGDTTPEQCQCEAADHTLLNSSNISLANVTLDQDHRQLELLASQLTQTQTTADALAMIIEIHHYCQCHFYREEQIMLQCPDYPFRKQHHDTHCALLNRLQQIEAKCSVANVSITDIIEDIQHITTILPIHILGMDAGLAPYITAKPELAQFIYTMPDNATLAKYFYLSQHDTEALT